MESPSDASAFTSIPVPVSTGPAQQIEVGVDEQRVVRALTLLAGGLVVVGFLGQLATLYLPDFLGRDLVARLTDLGGESNLPAAFSVALLVLAALLLGVIARAKRAVHDPYARSWTALTWIFGFLALDEAAMLHERLGVVTSHLVKTEGFLAHAWVIPYALLGLWVLFAFLRFLTHLPARTRHQIVLAGVIYVGGALGFEMLEGEAATASRQPLLEQLLVTAQEAMEMAGVILLIGALLRYIRLYLPGRSLQLGLVPRF